MPGSFSSKSIMLERSCVRSFLIVMQDFAKSFYNSKKWHDCRDAYYSKAKGLCERCLANGIVNTGEIVHHKIYLTPENINDDSITLSFENLFLVCRKCHAEIHNPDKRRYKIDELGRVEIR